MRKINLVFVIAMLLSTRLLSGATYYVATDGSNTNTGTISSPFASITYATGLTSPGDTVYVRGGTYMPESTIRPAQDGSNNNCIYIWNYRDEIPVFDFSNQSISGSNRGFQINRDYVYIKGLIIEHAGDNGLNIAGSDNIIEQVIVRYNADSGLQMAGGAGFNLILNCDSYGNYDAENHGENADGYAAKFDLDIGNTFRGCRSWGNSDDGWDFWEAGNGVQVDSCWSFANGYNHWGDSDFQGDGNGYKLGHGEGAHYLKRSIAAYNTQNGFDVNSNQTGVIAINNTAYHNHSHNFYFDEHSSAHQMYNNLSYDGSVTVYAEITALNNSWNGFTISESDFASLDSTGLAAPRNADGSLPDIAFLHLAENSNLVDAGMDVGVSYKGDAPDLGAFEYDPATDIASEEHIRPEQFKLTQNYPNPFNPGTTIRYQLPVDSQVRISVYDLGGNQIVTLIRARQTAGEHSVSWNGYAANGRQVSAGIYFYRISTPGYSQTRKMTLLR